MIPLAIPNLCGKESEYLQHCVDTNFVSSVGPFVDRFEEMVAAASGTAGTVATSSGTTGLHAALVTVGVMPGDLVIMPSFTFIATANAVSQCGAEPWLFDIEAASWTLDADLLQAALDEQTEFDDGELRHRASGRRVAAIVPVFPTGGPADMDTIVMTARRHGLPVVVDAACALGATFKGLPLAACGADLYVFSFNGNKTVTAGGGGAIAGTDQNLLQTARHLTTTARVGRHYDHDRAGFNYRMTNLQAAVGCAQMENLDRFVARKTEIHRFYTAAFADLTNVSAFPETRWGESAHWMSGLVLPRESAHAAGDFAEALVKSGIEGRPFWKPMHLQAPYAGCPRTDMPVCGGLWQRLVTLPSSTMITDDELRTVAQAVTACIEEWHGAPAN